MLQLIWNLTIKDHVPFEWTEILMLVMPLRLYVPIILEPWYNILENS